MRYILFEIQKSIKNFLNFVVKSSIKIFIAKKYFHENQNFEKKIRDCIKKIFKFSFSRTILNKSQLNIINDIIFFYDDIQLIQTFNETEKNNYNYFVHVNYSTNIILCFILCLN